MFRQRTDEDYETDSEGGVRHLFRLGSYEFHDTLDPEGRFHHYVLEDPRGDTGATLYETDGDAMYEFMARYLAGEYEKSEYAMERSPGHDALLDVLELAAARARSGETEFSFDDVDHDDTEVLDPGADEADPEDDGAGEDEGANDERR